MRRRLSWLPFLLAILAGMWLLWPTDDVGRGGVEVDDPARSGEAPDLMSAEGLGKDAKPPKLKTRAPGTGATKTAGPSQACTIKVYGPARQPRVGMPVRIRDPRDAREQVTLLTNHAGIVTVPGVALDGSVEAAALSSWRPDAAVLGRVRLTKPIHQILCPGGLVLETTFVDAVSDADMDLAWTPFPTIEHPPPLAVAGRATVAVLPGDKTRIGFSLENSLLPAHVAWEPSGWTTRVSRRARKLVMTYPLRRHARVHVVAEEHDGSGTQRARVEGFAIAGRHVTRDVTWIPDRGGMLVRGIPYFRDRPLEVLVTRPAKPPGPDEEEIEDRIELDVEVMEEASEREFVVHSDVYEEAHEDAALGRKPLPPTWEQLCTVKARFPKNPLQSVLFGADGDTMEIGFDHNRRGTAVPEGEAEVLVLDRAGKPVGGARVWCSRLAERTDASGRARWRALPAGEQTVRLDEPGFVSTSAPVVVRSGQRTKITLREAAGSTLEVRVVDKKGEPLPYAMVALDVKSGWIDIEDGVQRIDPFTDIRGRRTMRNVPSGKRIVRAHWGGLDGYATVVVKPGQAAKVTVTLKE